MKAFRWFRNFFIYLFWIFLSSLASSMILGYFLVEKYEDEIKQWSVSRINQALDTKISIEEMDASFLRTFPYFSLVMKNVTVWSSPGFNKEEFISLNTDSLFTAKAIYLQFNALDLLRSKMRIQRIYAENGNISLLVDSKGQTNYHILREEPEDKKANTEKSKIYELEALKLTGFGLEFNNLSKKTYSSTTLDDLLLKGKFSGSDFSIGTNAGLVLHDFTRNGFRYANDYSISLRMILEMNDKLANIRKGELVLNTIRLNTTGNIELGENPSLDLGMESRNINISTLLSSFPQKIKEKIPFRAQGRGDLAIKVKGPITATKVPSIQSVYVLNLSQLNFQKESLRNIKIKGSYTNGDKQRPSTTELDIIKFRISDRNSTAEGSLLIRNFIHPSIQLNLNGMLDASQIFSFFPGKNNISMKGNIIPNLTFNASLNSFRDFNASILGNADLDGKLEISGLNVKFPDLPGFTNINGKISFKKNNWYPELSLAMGKSDFDIKARTDHIPEILLKEEKTLKIEAFVHSKYLDLEPFLAKNKDSSTRNDNEKGFSLPSFISGRLNCTANELNTGYFSMQNVTGIVDLAPGQISIPGISFETMSGNGSGSVALSQDNLGDLKLKTRSRLTGIDIKQLFAGFNNFGQSSLRAEHVGGGVTGDVSFNATFDSTFSIRNETILTEASLVIQNGELVHFEPLRKLSKFIEVDELEHIRFSTLKNTVLIRNSQMIIPEMDIHSNAFNITASGTHNFSGHFDYKLKILLSELLTGKAKNKSREFTMTEEDRRASLYLSIAGTSEDYSIKYDKKEAMAAIKVDLQKEKNTLKTILHEEFGLFRKDSLKENTPTIVTDKPGFIIEWDEYPVQKPETGIAPGSEEGKRKKRKEILKKQGQEGEFELEWDDEDGG